MTPAQNIFLLSLINRFVADRPKQSPADWCCEHIVFDEPDNRGPFNLAGREYMREALDDWANPEITDQVEVQGSQTGKSSGIMGGATWTIVNAPSRIFWVMPTRPTVASFSRTRWQPSLRATPITSVLIPTRARRHDFSTFEQQIGGSIIDMRWSNSPASLSSTPARVVILDEVDKFNEGGKREADAVNLAEQRANSFACPKRIKTSTPTLVTGLIWQEFLKTDQRRRFVPCPHCQKFVVLIWSKNYTVFKLTGEEAEAHWDKEAKRADGTWDLERVKRSAHYRCPHCAGRILDAHKTIMDRNGQWRPTARAAEGYRGRHLPSFYSSSAQMNVGEIAVKFLQAKGSLLGLQGIINGTFAEPYQAQDTLKDRVELVTSKSGVGKDWSKILTVDCQQKSPHFWYVVRAWKDGKSEGVEAGSRDTWEEIREIQDRHEIPDAMVAVDSGFGAKSDAEVYRTCVQFAEIVQSGLEAFAVGWMPSKGMPGRKRWKDEASKALVPWFLAKIDPFIGTAHAGRVTMGLFEFSGDFFKDILTALRERADGSWSIAQEVASEEYWRHMDGEIKKAVFNKRTGFTTHEWVARSKHWPNHLWDCEVLQIAFATFHKLFIIE